MPSSESSGNRSRPVYRAAIPPRSIWHHGPHSGTAYRWSGILGEEGGEESLYYTVIDPKAYLRKAIYGEDIKRDYGSSSESSSSRRGWGGTETYRDIRRRLVQGKPVDPPNLFIHNKDCRAVGHEGRHRASIAAHLGIKKMPIILACIKDYKDRRYVYTNWKDCLHCYQNLPTKIKEQQFGGREPWGNPDFRSTASYNRSRYGRCGECGTTLSHGTTYCSNCKRHCDDCGTTISRTGPYCTMCKRACEDCGETLDRTSTFCTRCREKSSNKPSSNKPSKGG